MHRVIMQFQLDQSQSTASGQSQENMISKIQQDNRNWQPKMLLDLDQFEVVSLIGTLKQSVSMIDKSLQDTEGSVEDISRKIKCMICLQQRIQQFRIVIAKEYLYHLKQACQGILFFVNEREICEYAQICNIKNKINTQSHNQDNNELSSSINYQWYLLLNLAIKKLLKKLEERKKSYYHNTLQITTCQRKIRQSIFKKLKNNEKMYVPELQIDEKSQNQIKNKFQGYKKNVQCKQQEKYLFNLVEKVRLVFKVQNILLDKFTIENLKKLNHIIQNIQQYIREYMIVYSANTKNIYQKAEQLNISIMYTQKIQLNDKLISKQILGKEVRQSIDKAHQSYMIFLYSLSEIMKIREQSFSQTNALLNGFDKIHQVLFSKRCSVFQTEKQENCKQYQLDKQYQYIINKFANIGYSKNQIDKVSTDQSQQTREQRKLKQLISEYSLVGTQIKEIAKKSVTQFESKLSMIN